ncbi:O-methyltransferase aurJ [Physcia stellaris]|nr:O-methyltransferase aurJ [Physcia stellaris]
MSETSHPLEALGSTIAQNANIVSHYLGLNHLKQPSFDCDGPHAVIPSDSPPKIQQARQDLIAAALEMVQLATGPSDFLPNLATGFQYISCLSWLCHYDIFHIVPLGNTISYSEIAAAARVPEQRLKSILRMAMTSTLFQEQPDGKHVGHTATSALLARNDDTHAYATYMCAKSAPMAMHMTAAHRKWGSASKRSYETAYNIAFDTDLPFFDHIARDEARMEEFARYMRNVRSSEGIDFRHLVTGFTRLDIPDGGVIIDDLQSNVDSGRKTASETLAPHIASRLTFQEHDFTKPQPIRAADVYFLRMILHDWPDDEAVKILRNVVAAMDKVKSRLLVMDTVLPKPGSVPLSVERIVRARDLTMLQAFNSKERDLGDWKQLFADADPTLHLVDVFQPVGSAMSILELALGSPSA